MKNQTSKELAKFFCGITAWECFVHASLWSSGANPVVFGITLTESLNQIQTVIPVIVSLGLAYYAWIKK